MSRIAIALLAGALSFSGCSAGLAQAVMPTKPSATAAPATKHMTPSDPTKLAKSKACSAEADQKGLHGKARKTFREHCKKA